MRLGGFEGPYSKPLLLTNMTTCHYIHLQGCSDRWMDGPLGPEGLRDVCAGRRYQGLRGNRVSRISELINYGKTRMSLQVP